MTADKAAFAQAEAGRARMQYPALFKNDPFYSPNLGLMQIHSLAEPPRAVAPWRKIRAKELGLLRILFLASTYQFGHGVPLVIKQQAEYLARKGHLVFVGGPVAHDDYPIEGTHRAVIHHVEEAAKFAIEHSIDCIVAHTMPFMLVPRLLGSWPKTIIYDHGEPPPDWFPDAEERRAQDSDRAFAHCIADLVLANSDSISETINIPGVRSLRLGNSHMPTWSAGDDARRLQLRHELGWDGKISVLNVCRFFTEERRYKGIDAYAEVMKHIECLAPGTQVRFVLAGRATQEDARKLQREGFEVHVNVSDSRLADLYRAADVYMNLSMWEGYNLGIGQALAFGLPVIASDIPAHREFPVSLATDAQGAAATLVSIVRELQLRPLDRKPIILPWRTHQEAFASVVTELCGVDHSIV